MQFLVVFILSVIAIFDTACILVALTPDELAEEVKL